jgi:hypothetical protein
MKKNDLIKKLLKIKGNPDILFLNEFVEDWNDFIIEESNLFLNKTEESEILFSTNIKYNTLKNELSVIKDKNIKENMIKRVEKEVIEDSQKIKERFGKKKFKLSEYDIYRIKKVLL